MPICFNPIADFSIDTHHGQKKKTVFGFTDQSTTNAGCPLTWSWNFGDGAGASSTSQVQHPQHQFQASGTYTVSLTVSNSDGFVVRTDTWSDQVLVTTNAAPNP
jgi:PKD repeat protein